MPSQTCAELLLSVRSFTRAACWSIVSRSTHTRLTNAMRLLSGNHFGCATPVGTFVIRAGSPPPTGSR